MNGKITYVSPASLGALRTILSGTESRAVLGGGQFLIPQLPTLRDSPFDLLVDLRRVPESLVLARSAGGLLVGAALPLADIANSSLVRADAPLLAHVAGNVADQQTRAMATLGGSVGLADPASDLCAVLLALGAEVEICASTGKDVIGIERAFSAQRESAIGREVACTAFRLPRLPAGAGWAYRAVRPRRGAHSTVGVAVVRSATEAVVAVTSMYVRPGRAREVERALASGAPPHEAAERLSAGAHPIVDGDGDARYRISVATRLIYRALTAIAGRGGEGLRDHLSVTQAAR